MSLHPWVLEHASLRNNSTLPYSNNPNIRPKKIKYNSLTANTPPYSDTQISLIAPNMSVIAPTPVPPSWIQFRLLSRKSHLMVTTSLPFFGLSFFLFLFIYFKKVFNNLFNIFFEVTTTSGFYCLRNKTKAEAWNCITRPCLCPHSSECCIS